MIARIQLKPNIITRNFLSNSSCRHRPVYLEHCELFMTFCDISHIPWTHHRLAGLRCAGWPLAPLRCFVTLANVTTYSLCVYVYVRKIYSRAEKNNVTA